MVEINNTEFFEKNEVESKTTEVEAISLKLLYSQMVADARNEPISVLSHKKLFQEIFEATKEKLVIEESNIYFVYEEQPLTNFGSVVLDVIHVHEVEHVRYNVELLILSQHEKPKIVNVNSLLLRSNRWIEDLGISYRYEMISSIQSAIKIMAQFAPVVTIYTYSGWATNKPNTYIFEGQEICCEKLIIKEHDAKAACKYIFAMLDVAELRITIPLLAVALLSLVQSMMIQIGEFFKGVFCLAGQSQSGKTELYKLFFDFENGRRTNINFDSTPTAIIRIIGNKRDAPVTVDDYKPTSIKSAGNAQMLLLDRIIRMCGDDSHGYQKAGVDNSTVANIAHCIVSITAEEIRLQVQSTLARLLIVEITQQSMKWENLTNCQENHNNYKAFIVNYILRISTQGVRNYCNNLAKQFLQERHTLRNKLLSKNIKIDNRTNDQCTWLYISFNLFLKYALEVSAIDQEEFKKYREELIQIFLNLMENQAERINELDDVTRFFIGLRYLLDMKEVCIERLQARNSGYASEDSKSAIGFSKSGYVYLKNEVAFRNVVSYFKRFGKDFVISESTLRKRLNDNGHLIQNSKPQKSPIHRLFVNRKSYQCIKFEEARFNKLLRGDKNDGSETDKEIPDNWGERENANNILGRRA